MPIRRCAKDAVSRAAAYLEATYRERDRQIACRYRLCSEIVLWPFDIVGADYFTTAAPLQALGLPVGHDTLAGLRLSLTHRATARIENEMPEQESRKKPETWFAGCRAANLPIYFLGSEADAIALYEQVISNCVEVYFRYLDDFGDPVIVAAPKDCIRQIGFDEEDALFPNDNRVFHGFDYLREYFMFPRKFIGFRLVGLAEVMPKLKAKSVELLITFNEVAARLAAAVRPRCFHSTPRRRSICSRRQRTASPSNRTSTNTMWCPTAAATSISSRIAFSRFSRTSRREKDKVQIRPLYSASMDGDGDQSMFYTVRRLPRRRTEQEKRFGTASDYTGTDMFVSFVEPSGIDGAGAVAELSVRALCSNRHLPEHLPVGQGGADFRLLDDMALELVCVAGPTPPREPVVSQLRTRSETANLGTVTWRLVNMLSMNHLGLVQRGAGKEAMALREILSMFGNMADSATERKIRGIRSRR